MEILNTGKILKPYHHVKLDSEFKFDCEVWKMFLLHYEDKALCRPMINICEFTVTAKELFFYSDASGNCELGFGAVFQDRWLFGRWETGYVAVNNPNIENLELFALVTAVTTWGESLQNIRMVLFCDNEAVVSMINTQTSSCCNCIFLLRVLILNNLIHNRRIFARHVKSEDNYLSDALSRLQFERFWRFAPKQMQKYPTPVTPLLWPALRIWQNHNIKE